MFRHQARVAIILGAGFSKNAGLPLQREFSRMLVGSDFCDPIDRVITGAITEFLLKVFHWQLGEPLPSLEDLFTMIDLSAGSGHSLGRTFTPKMLRALRRMLIYRCFQIIDSRFAYSPHIDQLLRSYLPDEKDVTTHFISLNWDIVLERHLERLGRFKVDYCIPAQQWVQLAEEPGDLVAVAKVHGSSNWVYCDNCHSTFYDLDRKLSLSIKAGLVKADFRLFDEGFVNQTFDRAVGLGPEERQCRLCSCAVGPNIATFSYRKSFRTHASSSSWLAAEQILDQAARWVFVGYSLPDADYEFKHLLKSCQVKRSPKKLDVILYDDQVAQLRYEALFGKKNTTVFQKGLEEYVQILNGTTLHIVD